MLISIVIYKVLKVLKVKYQDHITCRFAYKFVCIDDKFSKPILVFREENAAYKFIKAIIIEYGYCKKLMKKHFNKFEVIEEEEKQFQSSNTSWICKTFMENDDEKVRDHCHIITQFTGFVT